jgi:predicted GNAT family N-acyltransferase
MPVSGALVSVDGMHPQVRTAHFDELGKLDLYRVLQLRAEVFVVEQDCAFLDIDGRDVEPSTVHLWLEHDDRLVGYARILPVPGATELGRIVTPLDLRGSGVGAMLMREAIQRIEGPILLKAQARLSNWYERFGFDLAGDPFMEDGIPHVPMRFDP